MMVFDRTSLAFIQKCEEMARNIFTQIGFKVLRSRFEFNKYLYPISIVAFEGPELGFFDSKFYQIGLNKKLIYSAKDSVIRDILRHEIAHYLTFLHYPNFSGPHGSEFKEICQRFGFENDISKATIDLLSANESKEGDLESERVLDKVQKLLKLAESSNAHEAELATFKANELLIKHSLNHIDTKLDETIYLDRPLVYPRSNSKLVAIYEILTHFLVRPVISHGHKQCSLEICGPKTNVILARYVAEFLDRQLEHLWLETKKESGLQGQRAKNSFMLGVASGFHEKMKRSEETLEPTNKKALTVVKKQLEVNLNIVYKRLGSTRSTHQMDHEARNAGIEKGKKLSINKGVESGSTKLTLPWRKS